MTIEMIEEGLYSSIQDLGRAGYQSSGFPVSGVMDEFSAVMANYLVGNEKNEAVLEMSFMGPSLVFHEDTVIALTGGNMSANVNQKAIPYGKPIAVQAGDILQLRTARTGVYSYLAVRGGFRISKILGSKSMVVRADIKGLLGRKLITGDRIPFHVKTKSDTFQWSMDSSLFRYIDRPSQQIRYIKGPQHDWFDERDFEQTTWTTTTQSNRMGYRLSGNKLVSNKKEQLLTEATAYGSIQVPPNGQPIVLMADSQPTGGYPKIGQVIQTDLGKLSQLRPGQPFRFKRIAVDKARQLLIKQQNFYKVMHYIIKEKLGGHSIETSAIEL